MYCMSPPQASSYPGSGNGRPGIHPPSHPPHCAKPEESGPLILRYNTHFSTDQWTAGGVLFISLCLLCVSPAFAEFSFTCLVGLTNALEQDGFISGFMGFYVKKVRGGPALNLPPPLSFKHFKFIVRCFAVSPGRASHEHGLRGDDVLLGGRPSLPPLPHYHPPHVQRVSSSRPALLHAHRVLMMKPVDFLSTQEVVPQPGAAVGGLLDGPSDRPRPRSGCRWVPLKRKHWSIASLPMLFVAFISLWMMFLFLQVNTGLTSDQPFGGTFPSFWLLSGRRLCCSADPVRCPSWPQTRSVKTLYISNTCVCLPV